MNLHQTHPQSQNLVFGQSFAQKLNFVIVDEFDVSSKSANDNLTELVNTLNQLPYLDFVVFNGLNCNLDEEDDLLSINSLT